MSWTKIKMSSRLFVFSMAALGCLGLALYLGAKPQPVEAAPTAAVPPAPVLTPTAVFPANAGTLGAIPDGPTGICGGYTNPPRDVTFTVSGISGTISDVRVSTTFGAPVHSWRGDLSIELRAPGGAPAKTILRQTGSTTAAGCGSSNDFAGPYVFFDTAPASPTWWAVAGTPTPAGNYQASTPGGAVGGGANTPITPTFAALGAGANGTWTLRILDGGGGDTGSISAASLEITTAAPPARANADYTGDGRTDFVVARATDTPLTEGETRASAPINGGFTTVRERKQARREGRVPESPAAPGIAWYVSPNGGGAAFGSQWGDAATDFIVSGDFDGDNRSDIAVWREAAAGSAAFYILNSSNSTVRIELFGQTDDDPAIIGDYDGDGRADPAVFRCPPFGGPAGQCFYYFRGSNANPGGNITFVPWGFGVDGDFFPNVGDFDGDGRHDFCIQRSNPSTPSQGQFVLLKSNGLGVEFINWGNSSDFIIPGDYDGDGRNDFCVRRTVSGARQNWILTRAGATSLTVWGITGDVSAPGDYDGDGRTDLAIWRSNVDSSQNYFWVLNSSNSAVNVFEWGQCATAPTCDFPVAAWAVH